VSDVGITTVGKPVSSSLISCTSADTALFQRRFFIETGLAEVIQEVSKDWSEFVAQVDSLMSR
jgi:hypothetical protein